MIGPVRGRYAASPTGPIHLGNARTALVAWLSCRAQGGRFVWRVEDLDEPRVVAGVAEDQLRDLAWLGLDWDEGPERGGAFAPYYQSGRFAGYEKALRRLDAAGRLFPCELSRRELADIASAPHAAETSLYPARLRPRHLPKEWFEQELACDPARVSFRFRVDEQPVTFADRIQGTVTECVHRSVGDFVLRRKDGQWAYQLAVVVDDIAMQITEVVRGADLLESTARQIQLFTALGAEPPRFAHVPLLLDQRGEKLSKRNHSLAVATLRNRGVSPERIVGYLAWTLNLLPSPRPASPASLVEGFHPTQLPKQPQTLGNETAWLA